MDTKRWLSSMVVLATFGVVAWPSSANDEVEPTLSDAWTAAMQWRSIGPANMGGRITSLAVYEADPCIWWAASASGGLLKTTNNGVTFEHQFDRETVVSIGDVQVSQSNPEIVWVGTGESNPRNSVSYGNGVYKSVDGGKTWKHMGLDRTFQTGRMAIHPENPDVVYVGSLGRLYGPNEERGLFKTTDGGETWEKILYVDDKTGVVDVQMHPRNPDTLLVATYERQRDGFDTNDPAKKWGPGSGLWKTTDGGRTFVRLTEGLPSCSMGRIGLSYHRADPDIVYAIIETEKIAQEPEDAAYAGIRGEDADVGARLTEVVDEAPAAEAGLQNGDIVIRMDDDTVHSYEELLKMVRGKVAGDTVEIEVSRDRKSVVVELTFARRPGAQEDPEEQPGPRGRRRGNRSPFTGTLGGQAANLQGQQGPDGHEFGGVYRSNDGGRTWNRINTLNPRPMYYSQIRSDPSDDTHLYVLGTSLWRSEDGGETFIGDGHRPGVHVDHHAMWIDPDDGRHIILGNDGGVYVTHDRMNRWDHFNHMAIGQFYHVTVGPRENYMVYGGLQDNGSWGGPSRSRSGGGPVNSDWFRVGGGDGFLCLVDREDPDQIYFESQNGGMGRINLRTGDRGFLRPQRQRGMRYRFNWRTPFLLSAHNSRIYYTAGNHVFRSLDRGSNLQRISPEITNTDRGSGTALAESPVDSDVLYVGTDDGALWMSRNGGHDWVNLFDPEGSASAAEEGEAPSAATDEGDPRPEGRRRGGFSPERMMERLKEADADGDGRIQKSEVPERMSGMFDRFDANDDGALTEKEIREAFGPPQEPAAAAEDEGGGEAVEAEVTIDLSDDPVTGVWEGKAMDENIPPDAGGFTIKLQLFEDGTVKGRLESQFNEGDIEPGKYDPTSKQLTFAFQGDQMDLTYTATVGEGGMSGTLEVGEGMFSMDIAATRSSTEYAVAGTEAEPARDDGHDWKPIGELVPGPRWVSCLETSRVEAGRVYLTLDGHRSDDDAPYVFVSEDYGMTWRSINANLPTFGSTRVIREDITNPDILYLGTEFGAWVSIDRGDSWTTLNTNLPTVAVHEIAQHDTSGEIIAGTHGRSIWILDVGPLRQMNREVLANGANLFKPTDVHYWRNEPSRGAGLRRFVGENPSTGVTIYYTLAGSENASLKVTDAAGQTLRELSTESGPRLHRTSWDLRGQSRNAGGRGPGGRGGGRGRFGGGPRVSPGTYNVVLSVGDQEYTQSFTVSADPEYPETVLWGEAYDEMLRQMEMLEEEDGDDESPDDSDVIW